MQRYIFAFVMTCSLYGTVMGMCGEHRQPRLETNLEELKQENKRLNQQLNDAHSAYWRLRADAYQQANLPCLTIGGKRTPLTDYEAQALRAYLQQRQNVQNNNYFGVARSALSGTVTVYKKYQEVSRIGQIVVSGIVFTAGYTAGVATGFPLGALTYALKKSSAK